MNFNKGKAPLYHVMKNSAGEGIRTPETLKSRILSPMPLAAWLPPLKLCIRLFLINLPNDSIKTYNGKVHTQHQWRIKSLAKAMSRMHY